MGAYEARPFSLTLDGSNSQAAFLNGLFANPLLVTVSARKATRGWGKGDLYRSTSGAGTTFGVSGGSTSNPARIRLSLAARTLLQGERLRWQLSGRGDATGTTDSISFSLRNVPVVLHVSLPV